MQKGRIMKWRSLLKRSQVELIGHRRPSEEAGGPQDLKILLHPFFLLL